MCRSGKNGSTFFHKNSWHFLSCSCSLKTGHSLLPGWSIWVSQVLRLPWNKTCLYHHTKFPLPVGTLAIWKYAIFFPGFAFNVTRQCLTSGHPVVIKPWHLTYCGEDLLKQLLHSLRHFYIKLWWMGSNEMDHKVLCQAAVCLSLSLCLSLPLLPSLSLPILPTAPQLTTSNIYYYWSPCLLTINSRHPKNQIMFSVWNCTYFHIIL